MTWLLATAGLAPLLLAALARWGRLWWTPALAPLPALAAALLAPDGARLEIPWLLLGCVLGLDATGRLFLGFSALLWFAAGVYAAWEPGSRQLPGTGRFRVFFLLAMGGNLWLILAQDLVSFYTGFALMGLSSYGLVIHHGDRRALRAGRVYLTMTLLGELALFCALVLIAAQTGTLSPGPEQLVDLRDLTIGLLLLGLAIKAGLVPLHVWLPLAHPAAPVPASAVLSGAMIKVALLGWLRYLPLGQVALPDWGLLLILVGLITLFFAIPIGLVQSDPKVILAYSSVSKMGFLSLILGLILLEPTLAPGGVLALVLYAAHHALAKGGLFLGVGLRHHAALQPLVLVGLVLLALSLAGTPASGGAVAKYGLKPVLQGPDWAWLGAAVTLGAVGTTFLMGRFLWVIWRTEPHPTRGDVWGSAAWVLLVGLVALYPVVLGSPAAWFSGTGPIGIAAAVVALMALVAWRKPRLLSPLVDTVGPGDLLALVRPVLAVFLLLGRALWRAWMGLFRGLRATHRRLPERLQGTAQDPERTLRAWPNAGGAWLGITALFLALLLPGETRAPRHDASPELAAVDRATARTLEVAPERASTPSAVETAAAPTLGPTELEQAAEPPQRAGPAAMKGPFGEATEEKAREADTNQAQEAVGVMPDGEVTLAGAIRALPLGPGPEPLGLPMAPPAAPAPAAGPVPPCEPQSRLVLRHPSVPGTLELSPCKVHQGVPRPVPAPPLTNPLVRIVQHYLRDLGYDPGPQDGLIGPRTLAAVRRFQGDQGFAATGVLTFALLERLQSAATRTAQSGGHPPQFGDHP